MNLNLYKDNIAAEQILEPMNTKEDGDPDTFILYRMVDGNRVLLMHLFDLNQNGRIDIVKHFKNRKMHRTETILDREGKIFAITDYDPETGHEIKKLTYDGQTVTTRLSFNNELRREEIDRNLDGRVDMWIHYRGGRVVKTEIDENFDGKNIKVIPGTSN